MRWGAGNGRDGEIENMNMRAVPAFFSGTLGYGVAAEPRIAAGLRPPQSSDGQLWKSTKGTRP